MGKVYKTSLTKDGWIVCGKCGKRMARFVRGNSHGSGITTKCPRCKSIIEFNFTSDESSGSDLSSESESERMCKDGLQS